MKKWREKKQWSKKIDGKKEKEGVEAAGKVVDNKEHLTFGYFAQKQLVQ